MTFDLPQVPRRRKAEKPTGKPAPSRFTVLPLDGEAFAIELKQAASALLDQLIEAGAQGVRSDAEVPVALGSSIVQVRRAGVPILTTRERRDDGGSGWLARYRLGCPVRRIFTET